MKITILILTTFALLYYGIVWDTERIIVQPGCSGVCSDEIKAAIYKMGPGYDYKMEGDVLRVYIQGQWQRLQY